MEDNIQVIFDEKDDGILNECFADLTLCHDDNEDETTTKNGTNMQE